ncbi:hypothetical protein A6R68_08403, partial [Neotoma lepida]
MESLPFVEDEPNKICEADRVAIKANIVHLMLSSPEQIQKQEYAKNPSVNWKHKDAAIYLVTSLASKAQTQK